MRRIFLFMNVSLDGYFEGPNHDISWAGHDEVYSPGQEDEPDTVLFGHRTYDMMKSFWPTPQAKETSPAIAKFMNEKRKIVASHRPFEPGWDKVTVFHEHVVKKVRQLKEQPGGTIGIFGSNTLCVSLMQDGLIDEFQILLHPVVIGAGTSLFKGLAKKVELTLEGTRRFESGSILLTYRLAR